MGNFVYMRMQAPDDAPAGRLHTDSKLFMDLVLRGLYFSRPFGSEKVRITSLGGAAEQAVHTDAYQRRWQVRRWTVEYSDEKVVTYALPVPGGYAILLNASDEAASSMYELDMKTLVDFVFVTYYGTLRQWRDFLALKEMLPAAFGSIAVEPSYGKEFRYRSPRLSFSYPDELMKVSENSDLHLKFSYFEDKGRIVWDVSSVIAGEDKDTTASVSFSRHLRPPATLPDAERKTWESLVSRRMPYSGAAFFDKSRTIIGAPQEPPGLKAVPAAGSSVLYSVVYAADGTQDSRTMEDRLDRFRAGVKIIEP
jgi:hypothetical protein